MVASDDFDCLLSAEEYLSSVAKVAVNPDVNVAAEGLKALTKLVCKSSEACRQVFLGPVAEVLRGGWSEASEVHHVRVYNV